MQGVYLDYAAATPLDDDILAAMQPFFANQFYNPSALYGPAQGVAHALQQARTDVAAILGAKPTEILFTAGGTEANNIAIQGILKNGGHVVYSAIEHDSVRRPCQQFDHTEIPVNEHGIVSSQDVEVAIRQDTVLVSVMYANNEIGTIQPIKRIAAVIQAIRAQRLQSGNMTPLYFHVDAAQAGNYLDLHVNRLGVDLMTLNGGKIYGPKQTGVLFCKTGLIISPLVYGGGQERGIRSGTENTAGVIGLAAALQKAQAMRIAESRRLTELQHSFINALKQQLPGVIINGSLKYRLPNNVHITLPGFDNERLLMAMDMKNIWAAAGSACSASHDEPSHVLAALGMQEDLIYSSIRFSFGRDTTQSQLDTVLATLKSLTSSS